MNPSRACTPLLEKIQMPLPPFLSLAPIFIDEITCIDWMHDHGITDTVTQCIVCSGDVRLIEKLFHCRSRNCRKQVSALANSFFAGSRLRCNEVLLFGYYWLGCCTHSLLLRFTGFGKRRSLNTFNILYNWYLVLSRRKIRLFAITVS